MSTDVHKTSIRAKIPSIKSSKDHLEWFRKHIGEPTEVEDEEDYCWFSYGSYHDAKDLIGKYLPISEGDNFGIEYILSYGETYETPDVLISFEDFTDIAQQIRSKVGEDVECKLASYTWYNGVDEPVRF